MLTPDYLLHCTDSLTELLDAYDNAVVSDIARRIVKTGYVTETAKHQLRQAQQMGLLYEDIIREIAQRTTATDNMVRTLFEDAGVETVETDNRLYTAAGCSPPICVPPRPCCRCCRLAMRTPWAPCTI